MNHTADALQALKDAKVVLVSACLLGWAVRYDGAEKRVDRLGRWLAGKEVVPVCPETAAGLGVPRPPADFEGGSGADVLEGRGRVVTDAGRDVTEPFLLGARVALEAAKRYGATVAILKARSPSCGTHQVYVDGALQDGLGVAAALLSREGVVVLSEEDLPDSPSAESEETT